MLPRFIHKKLKYNCLNKKILQNSKRIETQQDLNEAKEFWAKKMGVNEKIIIDVKLIEWSNCLKYLKDFLTLLVAGGAFSDVIKKREEYKIRIFKCRKSANEGAFVHELLHIKLGHLEKQKEEGLYWLSTSGNKKFEIEANKELIKYRNILLKRKKKYQSVNLNSSFTKINNQNVLFSTCAPLLI